MYFVYISSRDFVIIYTIMYAFKIDKKIFADISIFLMMSSNIDFTTGCKREI